MLINIRALDEKYVTFSICSDLGLICTHFSHPFCLQSEANNTAMFGKLMNIASKYKPLQMFVLILHNV